MVCGYEESKYEVTDSHEEISLDGIKTIIEIRKPIRDPSWERGLEAIFKKRPEGREEYLKSISQYISFQKHNRDGKIISDFLYKYGLNTENLMGDWRVLVTGAEVDPADLLCSEWIKDHYLGYNKAGMEYIF
jgi:hypothetical protein